MIARRTDIRTALRSRQRGIFLNPFRFGGVKALPAGAVLASAYSSISGNPIYDPMATGQPTWPAKFGGTIDLGTFSYSVGTSDIVTSANKVIPYFRLQDVLILRSMSAVWPGDISTADIEFLDLGGVTKAALRVTSPSNFNSFLSYGVTLDSMELAPIGSGRGIWVDGNLTFTNAAMTFTNTVDPGHANHSFTLACDLSQVKKIRISNMSVRSGYSGAAGQAYVILEVAA